MLNRKHWKYLIYLVMALYVVLVCISIYNISRLIQDSQDYTLKAGREIREIRTRMREVGSAIPVLLASPEMKLQDIQAEFARSSKVQTDTLNKLEKRFRGDREIMAHLRAKLAEVGKRKQAAAERLDGNISYEVAFDYYENVIAPEVHKVMLALDEAHQSVEASRNEILEQIHKRFNLVLFATCISGFIIVFMTMLYDRRMEISSRELAYRDELFKQLARGIDEVFIIASDTSSFDYVSPNSERVLGIPSRELYSRPQKLYAIMDSFDADILKKAIGRPPAQGDHAEYDLTNVNNTRFFKVRIYSIHVPSINQERYIIVINDQTAARLHQQALSDALERANAASAAKSSFLSHMSHEIRTPMNAIIGMTTIAMSRMHDSLRVADCLGKISDSSRHLLGLINDVLDMSKIESGKLSICKENFNLHALVENVHNFVWPQTKNKNQDFEIFLENVEAENLVGDAMRINQILLNILSNAIKFTEPGGSISLTIKQLAINNGIVTFRFTIKDTGIGMSSEFLERIYIPFEQANASISSKYGGTGLGMPITANLIAMMDGVIQVKSEEGHGTTFIIELPLPLSDINHILPGKLPRLRVLIVDDDAGACKQASDLLTKMGMDASWVLNGHDAVNAIKEAVNTGKPYQICLIDWNMPGMNGAMTSREIRKIADASKLIIVICDYDWSAIEEEARLAGADNFIAKPFFASTLHEGLLRAIRHLKLEDHDAEPVLQNEQYDFSGKRVLLVEDNEFNREIGQEFLEMVNTNVEHAENGKEAVDKFVNSAPGYYDIILMDVQMPVMNGYEATATIRASSHPDAGIVPIIAMTANAFNEDVAKAQASGMNAHLAKPIDIAKLHATLAKFLS